MFLLVRKIEYLVRAVLNVELIKSYKGQDLRNSLACKIKENKTVNMYWDTICRHLNNDKLKILLKEQIIEKWIDIRARSFVNAYMQMIRRKLNKLTKEQKGKKTVKVSKLAEPAMRKTLS